MDKFIGSSDFDVGGISASKTYYAVLMPLFTFVVTFLACPRKVTERRAPGDNPLQHARSSSVHFGNSPFGLRQSEMFNATLDSRLANHSEMVRERVYALPRSHA